MADVIDEVIKDIYARFSEPITIDDMARVAIYSRFHFSRMFRSAVGVPPGQFLTAVRIHEAKRLLLSTSLTVKEITARVGYTSVGTFSARFKNVVGLSPTAYRDCGLRAIEARGAGDAPAQADAVVAAADAIVAAADGVVVAVGAR
ncbi:MAG TPA: helix-turn-helix transcriptional regulator [Streptosporangiaceae bacterium]|nr:helix-turn-helix transcriptional regulator [Streptosporangiaceae bacterium]